MAKNQGFFPSLELINVLMFFKVISKCRGVGRGYEDLPSIGMEIGKSMRKGVCMVVNGKISRKILNS